MREYDAIVIGGGLAGLVAAAVAAKNGQKVMLMTKGGGTIAIGGGSIDVLGYGSQGQLLLNPADGLPELPLEHPYQKIGLTNVITAMEFFTELCSEEGYPYIGNLAAMKWLPTALGTMKPSCLVPKTMDTALLQDAEQVTVIGFKNLKDYYPEIIIRGLRKSRRQDTHYNAVTLETEISGRRDITALDIARWLDKEPPRNSFIKQLRGVVSPGGIVLIPPVLGTRPDYRLLEELEQATECRFIETTGMPPSITGLRLSNMLLAYLRKQGVTIIEQANVAGAVVEQGVCRAVVTKNIDRDRSYYAKSFILATGGFFGGGLVSTAGVACEPIFQLPVQVPKQEAWAESQLFSGKGQPFARFGLTVDDKLRPVTETGDLVLTNVHVVGRNLSGYDYCFEKSGNGVAIASGYYAGMLVGRRAEDASRS